jgi:hypothetical protein
VHVAPDVTPEQIIEELGDLFSKETKCGRVLRKAAFSDDFLTIRLFFSI